MAIITTKVQTGLFATVYKFQCEKGCGIYD